MNDVDTTGSEHVTRVISGRARDLGDGFVVKRVLPFALQQAVGPFIFFDHFGPLQMKAGSGVDVRPHPHIGLSTVTYLFAGEMIHRDSLGVQQEIAPGAVNWMTAGKGIVHSERSSTDARKSGPFMHGLQLWVALPKSQEEIAPSFVHHAASDIPEQGRDDAVIRVVAGTAYGVASPAQGLSPLFYVEASFARGGALALPSEHQERAAYVVEGSVDVDGVVTGAGNMIVFRDNATALRASAGARVMLLGGAPLDGPRHLFWNFVSSSAERIAQAKEDWRERRFPLVPGDETEFTPLPPG